jgi:hypothetical protein
MQERLAKLVLLIKIRSKPEGLNNEREREEKDKRRKREKKKSW